MDKVAIFIDGAYLDKTLDALSTPRLKVDCGKLSAKLSGGKEILRTYYYDCPPHQSKIPTDEEKRLTAKKNSFFNALSNLSRFQVRQGKLAKRIDADGRPIFQQKRVDILMAVDMVLLSATRQIERAVLLTGDSDLVPAIEVVKASGVLVLLAHGPRGGDANTVHRELWQVCDERQELDANFFKECRLL